MRDLGAEVKVSLHLEDPGSQVILAASRVGGGSFRFGGIGTRGNDWGRDRSGDRGRDVIELVC